MRHKLSAAWADLLVNFNANLNDKMRVTTVPEPVMGGYGYSKEYKAEQRFRDAWGWGIAGGSIDIQKVNIAAALAGRRFNQRAK